MKKISGALITGYFVDMKYFGYQKLFDQYIFPILVLLIQTSSCLKDKLGSCNNCILIYKMGGEYRVKTWIFINN